MCLFFVHVGCWAGEGAALGTWPAPRGENQEPQHRLDHLPTRLPHHTHHSISYLNPVTCRIVHTFLTSISIACKVMKHSWYPPSMPFVQHSIIFIFKLDWIGLIHHLCDWSMYCNLDLSLYWMLGWGCTQIKTKIMHKKDLLFGTLFEN